MDAASPRSPCARSTLSPRPAARPASCQQKPPQSGGRGLRPGRTSDGGLVVLLRFADLCVDVGALRRRERLIELDEIFVLLEPGAQQFPHQPPRSAVSPYAFA